MSLRYWERSASKAQCIEGPEKGVAKQMLAQSLAAVEEVGRGESVIRIFRTRASDTHLPGAQLMEQDEQRSIGQSYFDMHSIWQWRQQRQTGVSFSQQHLLTPGAAADGPLVEESGQHREPDHMHKREVSPVGEEMSP